MKKALGEPVEEENTIASRPIRFTVEEEEEEDDGVVLISPDQFLYFNDSLMPNSTLIRHNMARQDRLSVDSNAGQTRTMQRSPSLPETGSLQGRRLPKSEQQIEEERETMRLHRESWSRKSLLQ